VKFDNTFASAGKAISLTILTSFVCNDSSMVANFGKAANILETIDDTFSVIKLNTSSPLLLIREATATPNLP
jgi:hypothetical protein